MQSLKTSYQTRVTGAQYFDHSVLEGILVVRRPARALTVPLFLILQLARPKKYRRTGLEPGCKIFRQPLFQLDHKTVKQYFYRAPPLIRVAPRHEIQSKQRQRQVHRKAAAADSGKAQRSTMQRRITRHETYCQQRERKVQRRRPRTTRFKK